eukprot:10387236-Alexandrium_andersonii.AAC.1
MGGRDVPWQCEACGCSNWPARPSCRACSGLAPWPRVQHRPWVFRGRDRRQPAKGARLAPPAPPAPAG